MSIIGNHALSSEECQKVIDYLDVVDEKNLWVYTEPNKFFVVRNVNGNPVRYNGWWSIPFIQYNTYATAMVEDSKVMYFVTVDKEREDGV